MVLTREGAVRSRMVFAEGIKDESFYDLGFGSLLIGICAQKIEVELGENGGRLHIDYTVEIEQSMSSRNSYEITITPLEEGIPCEEPTEK